MNLRIFKLWRNDSLLLEEMLKGLRNYSTRSKQRVDLRKLRPMILKRIEERAKDYPFKPMLPVAREVLQARNTLYDGVSTLIHHIPVWTCRHCPEVYIGERGHLIRTCHGPRHHAKNMVHDWLKGNINDIIVTRETFHLHKMFQNEIKHHERFDYQRIPAVVELCLQAGVDSNDPSVTTLDDHANNTIIPKSLSEDDLRSEGKRTLGAWETLRSGVHKLLMVYPARVCTHCGEVHVGPSGHKARTCGVFKYEKWLGAHFWKQARIDDLVPPNIVWYRRRQDPPVLIEEGRNYYGHAPAVVDLCSKAGALVPKKYFCMMKMVGMTFPLWKIQD
ncbi:hypothetical protein ACS0TY_029747 [Phlomoides rotata]